MGDIDEGLHGAAHKEIVEARVAIGRFPVVGPGFAAFVGDANVFHEQDAGPGALDGFDGGFVAMFVEVAIEEDGAFGGIGEDAVEVFAEERGFVSAHESLIGFRDFAHGLQVDADEAEVEVGAGLDSRVEETALNGEGLAIEFVGEVRDGLSAGEGEAGEETEAAGGVATLRDFGVGEVDAGGFEEGLNLFQVVGAADFAETEDIRGDGLDVGDDCGFFGIGFGGIFEDFVVLEAIHDEPVPDVVSAENEAVGGGGLGSARREGERSQEKEREAVSREGGLAEPERFVTP